MSTSVWPLLIGLLSFLYLLSFVLLAVVRIGTGLSIQRLGYFSLKRIAYAVSDGVRIEIKDVSIHLHRPSYARPTWVTLRVCELKVVVDPASYPHGVTPSFSGGSQQSQRSDSRRPTSARLPGRSDPTAGRWKRLFEMKEMLKRLHTKTEWLRFVDIDLINATHCVIGTCSLQVSNCTIAIDTRYEIVERGRLFRHKDITKQEQKPAEWTILLKNVFFALDGKSSVEIVDSCAINIHGLLYRDIVGLRDTSVALKLGRVYIPLKDMVACRHLYRHGLARGHQKSNTEPVQMQEGGKDDIGAPVGISKTPYSDRRMHWERLLSSLIAGIQEIQLAASFVGASLQTEPHEASKHPDEWNFAMNEFGIDLFRLEANSPAHRTYFPEGEMAHQALLAAISIAISLDQGERKPERFIYVPMATTTVKTTLASQIFARLCHDKAEKASILIASLSLTSPSLDLDLTKLPHVLGLFHAWIRPHQHSPSTAGLRIHPRSLPRVSFKASIQEPVARMILPQSSAAISESFDYDLLTMSISSVSLELEAAQVARDFAQDSISLTTRISSYHLYYQNGANQKLTILISELLEVRTHVTEDPDLSFSIACSLDTFSVHLVRSEIVDGITTVLRQLRGLDSLSFEKPSHNLPGPFLLQQLPSSLRHARFEAARFCIEVAGHDIRPSENPCGVAIQIENLISTYSPNEQHPRGFHRYRTSSSRLTHALSNSEHAANRDTNASGMVAESRKLTCRLGAVALYLIQSLSSHDSGPFVSIPKIDVIIALRPGSLGRSCDVKANFRAFIVRYSLLVTYASVLALRTVRLLTGSSQHKPKNIGTPGSFNWNQSGSAEEPLSRHPERSIHVSAKVTYLQVQANLPHDPPMLLRISGLDYRASPEEPTLLKGRTIEMCTKAFMSTTAWASILFLKNVQASLFDRALNECSPRLHPYSIDVTSDLTRFAIPHQMVFHQIVDNLTCAIKATEQIRNRFSQHSLGEVGSFRTKPKLIPKTSFKLNYLILELEDGLFDWKLGLIYRLGLSEQRQRLAREEAFRIKTMKVHLHNRQQDPSSNRQRLSTEQHRATARLSQRLSDNGASKDVRLDHAQRRQSSAAQSRHMRYDAEGMGSLTENASITSNTAWFKLKRHDAINWHKKIRSAQRRQNSATEDERHQLFASDEDRDRPTDPLQVLEVPEHPALCRVAINDFGFVLDRPSFPVENYRTFLAGVGKGNPPDLAYSLLVPMNLQINLGETRISLRNYPLPLLHIPEANAMQPEQLPCWSVKADFVIAEEYHGEHSMRTVEIDIVPECASAALGSSTAPAISIRRSVLPVKTYSNVDITINTCDLTNISWGTAYQPAIQDVMQVIEKFTKPRTDCSRTIGFWDKMRLTVHSRVRVVWKGGGDVQLRLKGSRDPYAVSGYGAGFVMCFRDAVKWEIRQDDDPKKFMTVSCNEFILAVPDYSQQARKLPEKGVLSAQVKKRGNPLVASHEPSFQKVIMKLSGRVRWLAGLVFERNIGDGTRSFRFKPHYEVVFKIPECCPKGYDALSGFSSDHIHLSLAVVAPVDRDWSISNSEPSPGYNIMHTSPRFFTHFFDWWSLFSGVMSLPVRQGRLFAKSGKPNPKFGRHLATIKYNLLLSPFLVSHIYKHGDKQDAVHDATSITGLKVRIDSFMLDLHQRREEFAVRGEGRLKSLRTSGMRINEAQLDFLSADIRAISAHVEGHQTQEPDCHGQGRPLKPQSAFSNTPAYLKMPPEDAGWMDMDDFVELKEIWPCHSAVKAMIMPLAFAPRFTYLRQTDHRSATIQHMERTSAFGNEPTHYCIMSRETDPDVVQAGLVRQRLQALRSQLHNIQRSMSEIEPSLLHSRSNESASQCRYGSLQELHESTKARAHFMGQVLQRLSSNPTYDSDTPLFFPATERRPLSHSPDVTHHHPDLPDCPRKSSGDGLWTLDPTSGFKNRFLIHNVQLKWNNSLRDIIMHYVHQVNQRRGFVYYMSRRAVRFIIDIVEEQTKSRDATGPTQSFNDPRPSPAPVDQQNPNNCSLEARIESLMNDGKGSVDANDPQDLMVLRQDPNVQNQAEQFATQDSYHLRLVAPQIQLQSTKNATHVVLVTAKEMELRVVQIMDKHRITDDVSGLVQRRYSLDTDAVQVFVTSREATKSILFSNALVPYGTSAGSHWPPWAPLETNFDFRTAPPGWVRIVEKTSASLRYDKYNNLRLKYNSELTKDDPLAPVAREPENRMDHLRVDFPQLKATCDSVQYYAMYIIVLDLLLYSEPLEKVRNERLEKIMLAADFSDLTGSPEVVASLQARIRDLEEIRNHFQLHVQDLDQQGQRDFSTIKQDLASCEDELFFLMKAITSSQRKTDERLPDVTGNGVLRWYLSASEIAWLLMKDSLEPLAEIQLKQATYDRTDNSDGSNQNSVEIGQILGLNLLPNATYPEMITPFFEKGIEHCTAEKSALKMFKVRWLMLEAIAGIPVLDQFEINLVPLKLQLEKEIGMKIFDYIFPDTEYSAGASLVGRHASSIRFDSEEEMSDSVSDTSSVSDSVRQRGADTAVVQSLDNDNLFPGVQQSASGSDLVVALSGHREFLEVPDDIKSRLPGHPSNIARSAPSSRSPSLASLASLRNGSRMHPHEDARTHRKVESLGAASLPVSVDTGSDRNTKLDRRRRTSKDSRAGRDKVSDDLTEMVSRASNFMTLAYVKIPSVVLCLSYRGQKARNLEDIHNFVFRMPALEYRNKTWSNFDLALHLKKDVIKALLSHTGAIIGHKLSHHRPSARRQKGLWDATTSSSTPSDRRDGSVSSKCSAGSVPERSTGKADLIPPPRGI